MPVVITAMKNQPSNRASLDWTARTHRSTSWYMPPALPAGAIRASENATSLYGHDDRSCNDDDGLWAASANICRQRTQSVISAHVGPAATHVVTRKSARRTA